MNARTLLTVLLLTVCAARADEQAVPLGNVVAAFAWYKDHIHDAIYPSTPSAQIDYEALEKEPGRFGLKITHSGSTPYQMQLVNFGDDWVSNIKSKKYAIVGEVRYENVASGSYLEMWSYFGSPFPRTYPEAGAYFSRTLADTGPMRRLEGTSDWREFWLPFDATGAAFKLRNVVLNLHLTGQGTVHLRAIRLVQYPDAPLKATVANNASGQAATQATGINLKSFLLGIATACAALLASAGSIFIVRQWQRRHHERELRRIASLDS